MSIKRPKKFMHLRLETARDKLFSSLVSLPTLGGGRLKLGPGWRRSGSGLGLKVKGIGKWGAAAETEGGRWEGERKRVERGIERGANGN